MSERVLIPAVDIYEKEDSFLLVLDMPGTTKEDIDIEINDDALTLNAKVKNFEGEWKTISREFRLANYRRTFTLSKQIDRENIQAVYENGILTLTLAKAESAKPKKIQVQIAS